MRILLVRPPLEAKRLLFSEFASKRWAPNGDPLDLSFVDVRKAYFNATPVRNTHLQFPNELGAPASKIAHLKRCVYGTRDAGLLWEETYAQCLSQLGVTSGVGNPCCFTHRERGLSLVVHGDDFTTLGRREDPLWFHESFAKSFEIRIRGILRESADCEKDVRILNRIVRVSEDGILYESDPEHVEILVKTMNIKHSRSTPGDKNNEIGTDAALTGDALPSMDVTKENDEIDEAQPVLSVRLKCVSFNDEPDVQSVTPYEEKYGRHPTGFVFTKSGAMKSISISADPCTGKSHRIMKNRRAQYASKFSSKRSLKKRQHIWDMWARLGNAWETSSCEMGVRAPSARSEWDKGTRRGPKVMRRIERAEDDSPELTPSEATDVRALAARANYISQNRPDCAYITKELCREFAVPTVHSMNRLERLCRYLLGTPRLAYLYRFQAQPQSMRVFVDTDFAGCKATRRSTSGGAIMLGEHSLRHWSSTQTAVS